MTREIIILKTKNFKKWSESKLNLFIKNYNLFTPSFIADKKKKYIFYSKNLKKIYCNIYDKNFNNISKKLIINEDKLSVNEIYAPYVIKIKNFYLMLVSFWINNQIGKIILLKSKDLIKWKKINLNINSFNKNIKIISEPCVVFYKKNFFLFFEIKKKNNYWNIGYKMIDKIIL